MFVSRFFEDVDVLMILRSWWFFHPKRGQYNRSKEWKRWKILVAKKMWPSFKEFMGKGRGSWYIVTLHSQKTSSTLKEKNVLVFVFHWQKGDVQACWQLLLLLGEVCCFCFPFIVPRILEICYKDKPWEMFMAAENCPKSKFSRPRSASKKKGSRCLPKSKRGG